MGTQLMSKRCFIIASMVTQKDSDGIPSCKDIGSDGNLTQGSGQVLQVLVVHTYWVILFYSRYKLMMQAFYSKLVSGLTQNKHQ